MKASRTAIGALAAAAVLAGCGSSHRSKSAAVTTPTTTTSASITVPSTAGQTVTAAQTALAAVGLGADVFHRHSATVPSGLAIGTKPAASSMASRGEVVALYVSTGPSPFKLPNVVGKSQATAMRKLTKAGLAVIVTRQQVSGGTGTVTSQSPAAGKRLSRGATVAIRVTTAIPTVSVPLVTAQSEEQAVTTASKLGFAIVFNTQTTTDLTKDRIVLSQSPTGGTSVAKGSTLTLTVGVYTKKP